MRKKILFKAPLLTRSGYGEQSRFAMRALREREDLFDIFIQPLQWGQTSWSSESSEERAWIDATIEKTIAFSRSPAPSFDASFQVTIPNEWENIAPVNIGYTAGIETTKVAHQWLQQGNAMNRIVVVSTHAANTYKGSHYDGADEAGNSVHLSLTTPIDVVNYPVKTYENIPDLGIELDYDFNFLVIAQAGPRKNLPNTVKWFLEEFQDEEVGMVLKTNMAKNCLMDRERIYHDLRRLIHDNSKDKKCKVYLLHGDMEDAEIHALYTHPQIKALVSFAHGEGFGLPIFEAAYSGMPTVCPGWSGQLDFLINKESGKSIFYNVEYDLHPVPAEVVWDGVLIKESMWAYSREHSAKQQLRLCYSDLTGDRASETQKVFTDHAAYLHETMSPEIQNARMVESVCAALGIDPNTSIASTDEIHGTHTLVDFE